MRTDDFISREGARVSQDLLIAEDSYPRMVIVEFRAKNAFNARVTSTAILLVDAVGNCSDGDGIEVISIE